MLFEISYLILWWIFIAWLLPNIALVKSLGFSNGQIRLLFSLKVCTGVLFVLFYELYYGNRSTTDAFRFYDDANILFQVFQRDPATFFKIILGIDMQSESVVLVIDQLNNWYKQHLNGVFNDNMTIIRFNAVVRLISFDVYHIHTLIINFVGFIGLSACIGAVKSYVSNTRLAFLSILLFPGILFWGSGVLKEGLLFLAMGFLMLYGMRFVNAFSIKNFLGFFLFFCLGLLVKSYVSLALVFGIGFLITWKLLSKKIRYVLHLYLLNSAVAVIGLNAVLDLKIPNRIYQKQHDFINEVALNKPGSAFEVFILEPSWMSLFANAPQAFFTALFRPFIWETKSAISLMASFEVILLVGMALVSFLYRRQLSIDQRKIVLCLALSAFVILILLGWVTPVFGALVRYKIPALVFILIGLNIIADTKKTPIVSKWIN